MVKWSGPAKKHLKQIYDYIAQDSKYYAKVVHGRRDFSTVNLDMLKQDR